MGTQRRRWAVRAAVGAVAVAALAVWLRVAGPWFTDAATVEVTIPRGAGPAAIADAVDRAGAIGWRAPFYWTLRLSKTWRSVHAGSHRVPRTAAYLDIIRALSQPTRAVGRRVTIPEGFRLTQIGMRLEKQGIVSARAFLDAASDVALLRTLGIPFDTAEGYLFPDTYRLAPNSDPADVVRVMHRRFVQVTRALHPSGPFDSDWVILASIVQAEMRHVEEAPVIAGVYRNRLDPAVFPSRLLQADPTVSYGCEALVWKRPPSCVLFTGSLTRLQLNDAANPYNTYQHPGLPPGPICAPGEAALRAAMRPKRVPYLYFVAQPDGYHRFSVSLDQHNRAVRELLR